MEFSSDSIEADTESESQGVPDRSTAEGRISFREPASQHLEAALESDDIVEKDYHIRSALQRAVITEQNRSD